MPKTELSKDSLTHLYLTSITVLLVLFSLSDVKMIILYQ